MDNSAKAAVRRAKREAALVQSSIVQGMVKSVDINMHPSTPPVVNDIFRTVITVGGVDFVNLPVMGMQTLLPGEAVWVLKTADQYLVLGWSFPMVRPQQGIVSTSSTVTGQCIVDVLYPSGTVQMGCSYVGGPYAVGDNVFLVWSMVGPVAVGKLSQALPTVIDPSLGFASPPPPAAATSGILTVPPILTGTVVNDTAAFTSGGLVANAATSGAWFYGTTVGDSMLGRVRDTSRPPQFYWPGGAPATAIQFGWAGNSMPDDPSASGSYILTTYPGVAGWVDIDDFTIDKLIANRGHLWVGVATGQLSLPGNNTDPLSGALRIPWVSA